MTFLEIAKQYRDEVEAMYCECHSTGYLRNIKHNWSNDEVLEELELFLMNHAGAYNWALSMGAEDVLTDAGPEDDDYVLSPCGHLGSRVAVSRNGKSVGEFSDTADALSHVAQLMETEDYYPSIFWVSDHGNCWPIDPQGNEVK